MDALRPDDPQWVGPYRLDGRLGEGGMGSVFLGTSPGGRKVAVKLIKRELSAAPQFRERFAREVDAARVGGFHTAQVVDADPEAASPWLVTAFIPGPTLYEVVAGNGPLDATAVLRLGAGLAEGLAAIHKCGLVHRDLKPGNVIIADDGPRVIDFGIARLVDASSLTATGTVMGTYSYMSPEQIRADRAGAASDVFSLGSVLAFAATGHGPFDAPTLIEIVQRILDEPPALDGIDDGALREVLAACLAKAPEARPAVDELPGWFAARAAAGGNRRAEPRPVGAGPVDPRIPMPPASAPAAAAPSQVTRPLTAATAPGPPPPEFGPVVSTTDTAGDGPSPGGLSRRTLLFAGLGTAAAATAVGVPVLLRNKDKAGGSSDVGDKPGSPQGASTPDGAEKVIHLEGLKNGRTLAFSEDGRHLYGADQDTIRRWNPSTGAGDPVHIGAQTFLQPTVFSRDLRFLVRAEEGRVRVWDTATGKIAHTFTLSTESGTGQKGWPMGLAISADSKRLAVSSGEGLHLWELPSGKRRSVSTSNSGGSVAFRGDGGMLVSGWHYLETLTPEGKATGRIKGSVYAKAVVFSPDGSLLAYAQSDTVALWNVESRSEVIRFKHSPTALAFHPEGRLLVGGAGSTVHVWDTVAGKEVGSYECPHRVEAVAVSPDGKTVAIGLSMAIDEDAEDSVLLWQMP
ncbi:WD40 repeat domain-containing serine/threonine protein kinase [Streptomyces sp. NPDC059452]|uniref:WD40 repeat domain-containing serine/threonine protein kinase n=1 Tax=Streptomyces sp. NPDC059452 TaxID=3346835 RepID=UPI0036852055